jgi:hypothetical protein
MFFVRQTEKKKIKLADELDEGIMKKNSLSIKLVPEMEEDRRTAALMKYISTESSEERQKRKRDEIDARPVLPSSLEIEPTAAKIVRNFSFGSPSGDVSEKLLSPLQLGIIPKRNGIPPVPPSPKRLLSTKGSESNLNTFSAPMMAKNEQPRMTVLVSDGYGSSDSDSF